MDQTKQVVGKLLPSLYRQVISANRCHCDAFWVFSPQPRFLFFYSFFLSDLDFDPNLVKFSLDETNPACWAKMYWNMIWKRPGIVPFGANLNHYGLKYDITANLYHIPIYNNHERRNNMISFKQQNNRHTNSSSISVTRMFSINNDI